MRDKAEIKTFKSISLSEMLEDFEEISLSFPKFLCGVEYGILNTSRCHIEGMGSKTRN